MTRPSGDILKVGSGADRVYAGTSNGAWDTGFEVPAAESVPRGIIGSPGHWRRPHDWLCRRQGPPVLQRTPGIPAEPYQLARLSRQASRLTDVIAWRTSSRLALALAPAGSVGIPTGPGTTALTDPTAETFPVGITVDRYSAVPARPAMPTVTGTDDSVTAVGVEPNGDPTSYDWRIKRTSSSIWANRLDQTSLTQTWTSLQPDTEYEVQFRATNSGGDSEYSLSGIRTTDMQSIPPADFTNIPIPVAGDEWNYDEIILYLIDNLNALHALVTGNVPGTTFTQNEVLIGDTGGALAGVDLPNGALTESARNGALLSL